jgi:hypothetical protein
MIFLVVVVVVVVVLRVVVRVVAFVVDAIGFLDVTQFAPSDEMFKSCLE